MRDESPRVGEEPSLLLTGETNLGSMDLRFYGEVVMSRGLGNYLHEPNLVDTSNVGLVEVDKKTCLVHLFNDIDSKSGTQSTEPRRSDLDEVQANC